MFYSFRCHANIFFTCLSKKYYEDTYFLEELKKKKPKKKLKEYTTVCL